MHGLIASSVAVVDGDRVQMRIHFWVEKQPREVHSFGASVL